MKNFFVITLILVYLVSDFWLTASNPVGKSDYFDKNDIEKTQVLHPEKNWDKVFYGSSIVAASYIESEGSYINLGIDYGTISDIYKMLKNGTVKITNDLVIALNDISFYDKLDTNKNYIFHKKPLEHYLYFNRDRLNPFITDYLKKALDKNFLVQPEYKNQLKELYHGNLPISELEESNQRMLERFSFGLDDCRNNFYDLKNLIDYCRKKNIRLRAIWMPVNPEIPMTPTNIEVMDNVNVILYENNIETLDWCNKFEPEYFYDIGHLNYENGAPYFTQEINKWLTGR